MASIKIILWKHDQKKDGTFPIAIRITQNRKTRYVFTGKYIHERDWDEVHACIKKSHPNSARLNNFFLGKLKEANDISLEGNDNISSKQIQKKIKRKTDGMSFFQVGAERIKNKYMAKTFSVVKPELSILWNIEEFINLKKSESKETIIAAIKGRRMKRMVEGRKRGHSILDDIKIFSNKRSLLFEEIDTAFINKYKSFCSAYLSQKSRTITNQLIFIRTLFNQAIKEGIVDVKYYPFAGEREKIRIGTSHKIGLTTEEIEYIEKLDLEPHTSIWHTRNVWLFSFYFAGIRISDVLVMKWSDFIDGRLFYTMNKNEKPISLKIPKKAEIIINYYKRDKPSHSAYIFPFLDKANTKNAYDLFVKMRNASTLFDKYLKRIAKMCDIEKNLSNHIARHSFGNIAGDKIHPLMLQKLYRHSDLKTTLNYQANFIHKDADDALDAVINF